MVNIYHVNFKSTALTLILIGSLLTSCTYKPTIIPGQPSAKVEFNGYIRSSLNLAGEIKCGSLLGISTSSRDIKPIIHYNIDRKYNTPTIIPASENQVFLVKEYMPEMQGMQQLIWFKFTVIANKHYFIESNRVVTKKGLLVDNHAWTLSVTDENKQAVPFEYVQSPQDDPQCKKST